MKKIPFVVMMILALVLIPATASATCNFNDPTTPPMLPTILIGKLTIDGQPAPIGTEIMVKVGGATYQNNRITSIYGQYSPDINDQQFLVVGCYDDYGKTIDIYVRTSPVSQFTHIDQSLTWASGQIYDHFDLTASTTGTNPNTNTNPNVYVGQTITIEDTISSPILLDTDTSDGQVTYLFFGYILRNTNEGIIEQSSELIQLNDNTHHYSVTRQTGFTKTGAYELIGTIQYVKLDFVNSAWIIKDKGTAIKQTKTIPVGYPPVPQSAIASLVELLKVLWANFIALFQRPTTNLPPMIVVN